MSEPINYDRRQFLGCAAVALLAAGVGVAGRANAQPGTAMPGLGVEGDSPSLEGGVGWLNSQPLSTSALRGKVVLIDFWTYTCINWQRQLPYVRAWASKYREHGLAVIGVH